MYWQNCFIEEDIPVIVQWLKTVVDDDMEASETVKEQIMNTIVKRLTTSTN